MWPEEGTSCTVTPAVITVLADPPWEPSSRAGTIPPAQAQAQAQVLSALGRRPEPRQAEAPVSASHLRALRVDTRAKLASVPQPVRECGSPSPRATPPAICSPRLGCSEPVVSTAPGARTTGLPAVLRAQKKNNA